jgi:ammonia channel protein AmtB
MSIVAFWLVGYSVAYGNLEDTVFFGWSPSLMASSGYHEYKENQYLHFFLQLTFVNTSVTIVSGSIAERA